jgi:DNA-binding transcriptional ArsR family regulator
MDEAAAQVGFESPAPRPVGHEGAQAGLTRIKTEERRRRVARYLAIHGAITAKEMSEALGITQSTASRDIAAVKKAWRAEMIQDMDAVIARDLAELGMVKAEAWRTYVESCEEGEVVTTVAETKDGVFETVTSTNPKASLHALKLVMGCIDKRRRILGLDKEAGGGGAGKMISFTVKIGDRVIVSEASTMPPEDILDAEVVELDSTGKALPSGIEG